ncbi:MAG: hypothetical protein IKG80_03220 [Clostridia bacterium]|nr:hypothetical protein [Clostridia bacterium]
MKKLLSIILTAATLAMMLVAAIPAEANTSYPPNGTGWDPNDVISVKKADPADVKKDGVIGDGEYERYYPDLDAEENETSPLFAVAFGDGSLEHCLAMFPTMEYYFSWDEVHGFNFAVRNKPVEIKQVLGVKEGDSPEDDFCRGLAYVISFDTEYEEHPILYYALGRRTDTLEYLEGYYVATGSNPTQLGAKNTYNPTPGEDYIITYDYSTGYAMIEWSVPFGDIHADPMSAGSTFKGTISATAGSAETPGAAHDDEDSYAVTLGDFGYGVNQKLMHNHVTYLLSDAAVDKTAPVPGPDPDPNPNPNPNPADPDNPNPNPDPSNPNPTPSNSGTAPRTGDPMVIMAAVAAVSAAGAFIVRRKVRK